MGEYGEGRDKSLLWGTLDLLLRLAQRTGPAGFSDGPGGFTTAHSLQGQHRGASRPKVSEGRWAHVPCFTPCFPTLVQPQAQAGMQSLPVRLAERLALKQACAEADPPTPLRLHQHRSSGWLLCRARWHLHPGPPRWQSPRNRPSATGLTWVPPATRLLSTSG